MTEAPRTCRWSGNPGTNEVTTDSIQRPEVGVGMVGESIVRIILFHDWDVIHTGKDVAAEAAGSPRRWQIITPRAELSPIGQTQWQQMPEVPSV